MKNIIFILTSILFGVSAKANIGDQFSMIPTRYESKIKVGETKEFSIRIRNDMKKKKMQGYTLKLQEFVLSEDGRLDANPKTVNTRSLLKFARVSTDSINIEPGEEQIVKIIVSVPKDYKFGSGYLVYKLTQSDVNKKGKGAAFAFMKNLSGFIALNIESKIVQDIKIHDASIDQNRFSIVLENAGESYLKTSSKIVLMSNDKKIGVFDLVDERNRQEFLNLPSLKRTVSTIVPEKILKGLKDIKVNVIVSDVSSDYIKSESFDINLTKKAKSLNKNRK